MTSSFAPQKNKLSGKKTGNYYYGARYYDPKISIWLSVDPLAHKYPSLSPYVFTGNNPIMLVDPDGRDIKPINKRAATALFNAFSSFGSQESVRNSFGLVRASGTSNTYSSRYLQSDFATEKDFAKHARKNGLSLKGEELSEAFSLFQSLADQEVLELSIIEGQDDFSYGHAGPEGSDVVDSNNDSPKTRNERIDQFESENPDKVSKQSLDKLLEDGNYFPNQDPNGARTKGHVIINGEGNTPSQDANDVIKIIHEQVPQ